MGASIVTAIVLTLVASTTSKEERIRQQLAVPALPDLTQQETEAIEEAGSRLHKGLSTRNGVDD